MKKPKYYGIILTSTALKTYLVDPFLKNFIQGDKNKFIQCTSINPTAYSLIDVTAHYHYKEEVYSVGLQVHHSDILAVYYEVGDKNLGFLP